MLYIVPTPIGNLEDITLRAIRVLKEVDFILAEDTRTSGKLLKHLNIDTPTRSFHVHNEHKVLGKFIAELKEGKNIALVSDAGTPGISDPGFLLIREAARQNLEFTVLPGANAIIPAILLSGFAPNEFSFVGFLPPKKGRQKKLKAWLERDEMIVFYESPHRIGKLAEELNEYCPTRSVALVREISKMFESAWRGLPAQLIEHVNHEKPKGEMVVVIAPTSHQRFVED